ncbi:MAG: glycosyltransferase family 4 protein [Candidatus Helarchaeota archaeon]
MIGWDSSLATENEIVIGDSKFRHILYGKLVSTLHIIVPSPRKTKQKPMKLSENVFIYPVSRGIRFMIEAFSLGMRLCNKMNIDVITAQDPFYTGLIGVMLKRLLRKPLNIQLHIKIFKNIYWLKESKKHYLLLLLSKFLLKQATTIRVVSKKIKRSIIDSLRIPEDRIICFPVFTNIEAFSSFNQELSIRDKYLEYENIILFVGRLVAQKNVDFLIKAAKNVLKTHPDVLFLIIGDGPEREHLDKLVKELEIRDNVIFKGKIENKDLIKNYFISDIFVLPSNYEGWGLVCIEALAARKPVIMTNTGCADEVVIDGHNGYVIPIGDVQTLAKKIIYLIENPEVRKQMGQFGWESIQGKYSLKENAFQYRDLFRKTILQSR